MRDLCARPHLILLVFAIGCGSEACLAATVLSVDIGVADPVTNPGRTPNQVQAGFVEFSVPHQFASGDRDHVVAGTGTQTRTFGSHTVSIRVPEVNGAIYTDFASDVAGPFGDLVEDVVTGFGSDIVVDITGLAAGSYTMTTWHHVVSPNSSVRNFDILLTPGSAPTQTVATNLQSSMGVNPSTLTTSTFGFGIGANEDLQVRIDSVGGSLTALNGFTIETAAVPEPSLGALFVVMLSVLRGWIRKRQSHRRLRLGPS